MAAVVPSTPSRARRLAAPGAVLLTALLASACGSTSSASPTESPSQSTGSFTCTPGNITASGSTALQPLAQRASELYRSLCPSATVTVSGGGSSAGLSNVAAGTSDIGNSDVPASNARGIDAGALTDHQVAIVVFAIAANPRTGVTTLSDDQARGIFSGSVTNWKDVGGADLPITLIERKTGSGTRLSFDKVVMKGAAESGSPASTQDSTQLVLQQLSASPGAVSYLAVSSIKAGAGVTAISLDGVTPTAANVAAGHYPFYSHEHMYTRGPASGLASSFIAYVLSSAFQPEQVSRLGYLPISVTGRQSDADK